MAKNQKNYSNKDKSTGKKSYPNKRGKNSSQSYSDERFPDTRKESGMNDLSWYAAYPQQIKDFASIPFNYIPGAPRTLKLDRSTEDGDYTTLSDQATLPGICTIKYYPTVGLSIDATSAINVAARNLYTYLRAMNSGKTNYDGCDAMLVCLAVSEAYAFYAHMVRIYGTIKYWDANNRYTGQALTKAVGGNFDILVKDLANFRGYINYFATQISKLAVPISIPLYARRIWCETNIYKDAQGARSQYYNMVREGWLVYEELDDSTIYGSLKLINDKPVTVEDFMDLGRKILDPLFASEDVNIISGDIMKAFSAKGLASAPQIAEDYTVVPEYNPIVLSQFQNMHMTRPVSMMSNSEYPEWISQDPSTGLILSDPDFGISEVNYYSNQIPVNFAYDNPMAGDVVEATRLCCPLSWNSVDRRHHIHTCGTELVASVWIYSYECDETDDNTWKLNADQWMGSNLVNVEQPILAWLAKLVQFSYSPITTLWTDRNNNLEFISYTTPIYNVGFLDPEQLDKIHSTSLLSLFRIPGVAEHFSGN